MVLGKGGGDRGMWRPNSGACVLSVWLCVHPNKKPWVCISMQIIHIPPSSFLHLNTPPYHIIKQQLPRRAETGDASPAQGPLLPPDARPRHVAIHRPYCRSRRLLFLECACVRAWRNGCLLKCAVHTQATSNDDQPPSIPQLIKNTHPNRCPAALPLPTPPTRPWRSPPSPPPRAPPPL